MEVLNKSVLSKVKVTRISNSEINQAYKELEDVWHKMPHTDISIEQRNAIDKKIIPFAIVAYFKTPAIINKMGKDEIRAICKEASKKSKKFNYHVSFGMPDIYRATWYYSVRVTLKSDDKKQVKESSDIVAEYETFAISEDAIPMVVMLMEEGFSSEDAVAIFEAMIEHNPYLALLNIPLDPEPVSESEVLERDNALFEAFLTAYEATNGDMSMILTVGVDEAAAASVVKTVTNKVSNAAKATADTVKDAVTNPVRTVKRGINTAKNKVVNPLINAITGTINDFEKANEESKREMIIRGGFLPRLRRLFYKALVHFKLRPLLFAAIPGGFAALVAWFPITLYTAWQLFKEVRGDADDATKAKIIQELELELKMTREKIDDAKASGDKKAKYQLMRVENKIIQEIARIKYGKTV